MRETIRIALFSAGVVLAASVTSGCTGGAAAGGAALARLAAYGPPIASAVGIGSTVLSDVAKAACAGQAALNAGAEIAQRQGAADWVARLGEASQLAGLGCKW